MRILSIAIMIALALFAVSCDRTRQASPPRHGIVTAAPNVTEIVFALGEGDRVAAVSSYCDYPEAATQLPSIGGTLNPNLERIARLRPEIILVRGRNDKLTSFAARQDIPVVHLNTDSIAAIRKTIGELGTLLNCRPAAVLLQQKLQDDLEAVRTAVAGKLHPRVLILSSRQDHSLRTLYTVGGSSYLSELLNIAGGQNIFSDLDAAYGEVSKESVVMRAPDVILELHPGETLTAEDRSRYIEDWQALPTLPATKRGRIHLLTGPYLLVPGPRIALAAKDMAAAIHPGVALPELTPP